MAAILDRGSGASAAWRRLGCPTRRSDDQADLSRPIFLHRQFDAEIIVLGFPHFHGQIAKPAKRLSTGRV
jgi:hypothetical protein